MIRDDLTNQLIHLTKGKDYADASGRFLSILKQSKLLGSSSLIRGGFKCVCFSEAPISKLSLILANAHASGMRYAPFGVMVTKLWLYERGGRPVIYHPNDEYDLLHDEQKYRHVRYEPHKGIDHTWEREWRIKTDEVFLEPEKTTLIVPSREWEDRLLKSHAEDLQRYVFMMGEMGVHYIEKFPWHFIVLEDLGVDIPAE